MLSDNEYQITLFRLNEALGIIQSSKDMLKGYGITTDRINEMMKPQEAFIKCVEDEVEEYELAHGIEKS